MTLPTACPRIFCIGRNYAAHIAELGNRPDSECVVFMKPWTSRVHAGDPAPLPRDQGSVHMETEVVLRIGTPGRDIDRAGALEHVDGVTLGIDLTLRDVQSRLKGKGLPWEAAKSFDASALVGQVCAVPEGLDLLDMDFEGRVNGELRQTGHTRDMLFPMDQLIAVLSRRWRLLPGDLVFTGTPAGVGPVEPGDRITVNSPSIGTFCWECA